MSHRFFTIAEAGNPVPYPLTDEILVHFAQLCTLNANKRLLDLGCGRGEVLCRWSRDYEIKGAGVDANEDNIDMAQARAAELEVWTDIQFIVDDAADYPQAFHEYDVVLCFGGGWIGGGPGATLNLMRTALKTGIEGILLFGETFWNEQPSELDCQLLGIDADSLPDLAGLYEHFAEIDATILDVFIASSQEWDRYYARQWKAVQHWLNHHPGDSAADSLREWLKAQQARYFKVERQKIGWGLFALKTTGLG